MATTPYAARVASCVRAEIARNRITQAQVAEHLGLTQPAISRRMSGTVPFDAEELGKLADLLGVSVATLFGEAAA